MKKIMILIVSVVLGLALSACTSPSYPVRDAKIKEDITNYLKLSPHFSEVISIDINDRALADGLFSVNATIAYKDDVALIKGTLSVDYYKSDAAWVRKSPVFTLDNATAYVEPNFNDLMDGALGLNRSYVEADESFDYQLSDFEVINKVLHLSDNWVEYTVKSTNQIYNVKAELELDIDVRYTYTTGWIAVAVTEERFTETTDWNGNFKATFDPAVAGIDKMTLSLNGTIVLQRDSDGSQIFGNTNVSGVITTNTGSYDVTGYATIPDENKPSGREILLDSDNLPGRFIIVSLERFQNPNESWVEFTIVLNGKSYPLTREN